MLNRFGILLCSSFILCILGIFNSFKMQKWVAKSHDVDEELDLEPPDPISPPIPINMLAAHVSRLINTVGTNGEDGVELEYRELERRSRQDAQWHSTKYAETLENMARNRYANVLPVDSARVKLGLAREGTCANRENSSSDYINASYIANYTKEKAYIATQGPLQHTVSHFWQMVWENNVDVIVMLTKLEESDRPKCYKYWSDLTDNFDCWKVETLKEETDEYGICERKIRLVDLSSPDKKERVVTQFQLAEWPDHGLPERGTKPFRNLLTKVDLAHSNASPIVVHCSAGIGRTGTFCTVHAILLHLQNIQKQEKTEKNGIAYTYSISLPDYIREIRKSRRGMVQTKDQYWFCYQSIIDQIEEFPEKYNLTDSDDDDENMEDRNVNNGEEELEEEFEYIGSDEEQNLRNSGLRSSRQQVT